MAPVITLTTDFGIADAYVASMKGVILSINPKAIIVDICHSIEPRNVLQAAFILGTSHSYFPKGTIHLAVVDPGVGSRRKALVLKTGTGFFVAPDNGILSYVIGEADKNAAVKTGPFAPRPKPRKLRTGIEAISISNSAFWRQPVSTTFHGRDIFAPVAANLSLGTPMKQFGDPLGQIYAFPLRRPHRNAAGNLIGRILHVDNFGNLITDVRRDDLPGENVTISIGNWHISGISHFYAERRGPAAIIGSGGYLEISLTNGSAAEHSGAKAGDKVEITP